MIKRAMQYACDQCGLHSPHTEVGSGPPLGWYLVMMGEDAGHHYCSRKCIRECFAETEDPVPVTERYAYRAACGAIFTTPVRYDRESPEGIAAREALASAAERVRALVKGDPELTTGAIVLGEMNSRGEILYDRLVQPLSEPEKIDSKGEPT